MIINFSTVSHFFQEIPITHTVSHHCNAKIRTPFHKETYDKNHPIVSEKVD